MGDNGQPESAYPLQICQADCDADGDCETGLVCLQRTTRQDPVSIYCSGEPIGAEDYCVPAQGVVPPLLEGYGITTSNETQPNATYESSTSAIDNSTMSVEIARKSNRTP